MKVNYHTHTQRCRHAQGTEEDYIKAAIKAGIEILGFSDHAPFPDTDPGMRMGYGELDPHLKCLDKLTKKYAEDIILLKGLEIEYLPEYMYYYEELLTAGKFDYLLLGEHFYRDNTGIIHNITDAESTSRYLAYADAVTEAMQTGYFRMVAHPDLYMMNLFAWDENCEKATDQIINSAIKYNVILEYNANGLRREKIEDQDGIRCQYPHQNFWERAAATQVQVVVGSYCHNPGQVWDDALPLAYDNLSRLGITPVIQL